MSNLPALPPRIILFDGVCNLCERSVQWVLKRDPKGHFHFASLQGTTGKRLLQQFGYATEELNSFVLIENGKLYTQSTAALRVCSRMPGLWPAMYGFIIIPAFLRNTVYRFIARNRYRWFGKKTSCWLPRPEWKSRFLEEN